MRFEVVTESMPCHRCLHTLLLAARVPHPRFPGFVHIHQLCSRCDVNDLVAQGILAFFAVHQTVDDDTAEIFTQLVNEWLGQIPPPREVDPEAFEEDVAAWRRGELDYDEVLPAPDTDDD